MLENIYAFQATILEMFWCLNGFLSTVCNCCQLIQLILRHSNFKKRELGIITLHFFARTTLRSIAAYQNENWHQNDPGGRAFALYFRPHRRAFDSLSAPAPGNLPSMRKKKANSRGLARGGGGWAQVELTDA